MHARDGEISSVELLGEPFDLLSGVQEDDTLGDGDGLVKIAQSFELISKLERAQKMPFTFQSSFSTLT